MQEGTFDLTEFEFPTLRPGMSTPAWRRRQAEDALAVFTAQKLPDGSEEAWRYVDFDFDLSRFAPAAEAGSPMPPGPFLLAAHTQARGVAEVVDGWVATLPDLDGVSLRRLSDLSNLEVAAPVDRDKFASAHLAFLSDALRVEVAPGHVMAGPLVIDVQATGDGTASFPHLELCVGENAEAEVLVVYRSPDEVEALVVPSVVLEVGDGARLRYLAVQGWGDATIGITHQRLRLGRDATGRLGEVGLGGRLGRLDLGVELEGNGASAEVVGLYFGRRDQILDYRLVIDHVGRNTSSEVFLKGAVEDRAQSVFSGLLRIEKGALRSSAFETNRNLVLSEQAKAHSVPNLEILCDDVVCGHGSSVGPLAAEHLYYMQSRGIPRARAERLLIRGFFNEVVERLPLDVVAQPVAETVFRRFVEAQEEGRLT